MSRRQQRKGARVHNSEVFCTKDLGCGVDDRVRVVGRPHRALKGGESVRVGSPTDKTAQGRGRLTSASSVIAGSDVGEQPLKNLGIRLYRRSWGYLRAYDGRHGLCGYESPHALEEGNGYSLVGGAVQGVCVDHRRVACIG